MRFLPLFALICLVEYAHAETPGRLKITEGGLTISFSPPRGWKGSKFTPPNSYEFFHSKAFERVALTIGFTDLRLRDFSNLPEKDRYVFEQNSLADSYVAHDRQEGFSSSGITLEPTARTSERRIRIYLNVSNSVRFLAFIPCRGHVIQVCLYGHATIDLVAQKAVYVRLLDSIHAK